MVVGDLLSIIFEEVHMCVLVNFKKWNVSLLLS